MLESINFRNVNVHETNIGVLEGGFRGRSEIAQPRADGNDQVRVTRRDVRARSSGYANGTQVLGMIKRKRTFPGLGFADGDSCLSGESRQGFRCGAVEYATTGHDQRLSRGPDP